MHLLYKMFILISHQFLLVHIHEEPDTEPDHTVGLKLFALELRLDYMGTSVLMCRVSSLDVTLRDEWKINRSNSGSGFMPTRRPATIFLQGDLGWDQLQIMISKSTTPDLLKMFFKLDEFFSQQFKSSKRVFSSLQTRQQRISNSSLKRRQQKKRGNVVEGNYHFFSIKIGHDFFLRIKNLFFFYFYFKRNIFASCFNGCSTSSALAEGIMSSSRITIGLSEIFFAIKRHGSWW